MPKVVDRPKWTLLETSGEGLYGTFSTRWRLPDGVEREWREAHCPGSSRNGREGLSAGVASDAAFSWLLEKLKEARSPD
jgi:hypothetical protein